MRSRSATPIIRCSVFRCPAAAVVGWTLGIGLSLATVVRAADWPTYRHDVARSGITAESVSLPLAPAWVFRARHAPQPAWGDPKPVPIEEIWELRRRHFDDVFQPVAAGDAVFFGSSANHKVYCLDANTGEIRWTKITGGPVRLAPTLVGGRVYVASDDGFVYCLDAEQGQEIWKLRAAPEDRRVLGHGKMISLWPCRTGVLVDSGLAYFAAGIFPAERVFLYAVKADDGSFVWKNDTTGERPQSRVSPQGYMLASPTTTLRADGASAARRVRSQGWASAVRVGLWQERRRDLRPACRRTCLHGHRTDGCV